MVSAIVEGASQVLAQEGPSATTNRIAERAGVSVGSIYQYFPNKAAIFEAVARRHIDRLTALHTELVHELSETPPDQAIPAAVRGLLAIESADPALGEALYGMGESPEIIARVRAFEASIAETLAVYIAARSATGHVRAPDPTLTAKVLVRAMAGVIRRTLAEEPQLVAHPRFTDELIVLVEGYLRPAAGGG